MIIGVNQILKDHLATLRGDDGLHIKLSNALIFYLVPVALATMAWLLDFIPTKDFHGVSISFFGIFIALLLNIQVAIFGIFQRVWRPSDDERLREMQDNKLELRKKLLRELNSNISYLILVSCLALVVFLALFSASLQTGAAELISVTIYCHFLIVLTLIIRSAHALFREEYNI